ncbi:T9SS type A sorting domain-containing protein, partial [Prevotella sp.]|uniref:T9SS type A sorting domain-containing protein n=1 Tax=Prevotella sp. TaxID=59823 RepID=UPI002A7F6075
ILVDDNSNRVYIATDNGLCSYASDATQPSEIMDKDNVYAYPNPVTPEYTGYVTIVGLSFDADVKIVTSNGALVNSGRSTGGTYRWNGRDLKGKRVASGVYMVETATQDGGKGVVCKIAIVN